MMARLNVRHEFLNNVFCDGAIVAIEKKIVVNMDISVHTIFYFFSPNRIIPMENKPLLPKIVSWSHPFSPKITQWIRMANPKFEYEKTHSEQNVIHTLFFFLFQFQCCSVWANRILILLRLITCSLFIISTTS